MLLDKQIGATIFRIRKEKKKTQEEVARDGFISGGRKYISIIEAGKQSITVKYLLKIAKGLEVPLLDLLSAVDFDGIKNYHTPESLSRHIMTVDSDSPISLFYRGDISLVNFPKRVAIVGIKKPSSFGIEECKYITKWFVEKGYVIVSGLGLGIDTVVHQTCIENDGETIAVLPSGVGYIYPPENKYLADQIVESGGLLLSEYPENSSPRKNNFIQRDRIQTLFSTGVVIIEAQLKSVTMHMSRFTIQHKRILGCVEFDHGKNTTHSTGNRHLIRSGKAFGLNRDNLPVFEKKLRELWQRPS